ncbi:MAG: hypothetical protein DMG04_05120 [Acidobacteria bacterium]|nr:MAG: hypothetical protein DMG04_05120 [Acidobacteriota bacterium]PYQ83735.1 MAG: hypothetical protein DMG03_12595 [Acidobacteriota bacterium]PYR06605.1 MAG: hypothetical protein DMF99_25505 [Acidobacteriota bacterium]
MGTGIAACSGTAVAQRIPASRSPRRCCATMLVAQRRSCASCHVDRILGTGIGRVRTWGAAAAALPWSLLAYALWRLDLPNAYHHSIES